MEPKPIIRDCGEYVSVVNWRYGKIEGFVFRKATMSLRGELAVELLKHCVHTGGLPHSLAAIQGIATVADDMITEIESRGWLHETHTLADITAIVNPPLDKKDGE